MKVLLTGAAGLTGGEVCRLLLARGDEVTAVVRHAAQRPLVGTGASIAVADVRDVGRMDQLLGTHDVLLHVAGILLGEALARASALARPRHVVVVSSAAVASRHRTSAAQYRAGEEALRAVRPDVVLLRPTLIYGSPRDRNIHHVLAFARRYRFLPLIGDGSGLIQPVHFEDAAAAAAALVGARPERPVEIGGAAPLTVREAAEAILRAVGATPRLLPVPYGVALGGARLVDSARGSRVAEKVERMLEDRVVDNATVIAATGVRPRAFAAGIAEQAAHS